MNQIPTAAILCLSLTFYGLTACHAQNDIPQEQQKQQSSSKIQQSYQLSTIAQFNEPWAIASLKDGRLLITERKGKLQLFDPQTKQKV